MSIDYTSYRNAAKNIPDEVWQEAITERPKWEQKGVIPPEFDNDVWATEYYHFKTSQIGFFKKAAISVGVAIALMWVIDFIAQTFQIGFVNNAGENTVMGVFIGSIIGMWLILNAIPRDRFKERLANHANNLRNAPSPAPASQSSPQQNAFDVPPQDE